MGCALAVVVMCFSGDVGALHQWGCASAMAVCSVMVVCFSGGGVLQYWWCASVLVVCFSIGGVLECWWCALVVLVCFSSVGVLQQ